jgi:hypothetical protein
LLPETEFARHRAGLRGECFLRFDDVHVGDSQIVIDGGVLLGLAD